MRRILTFNGIEQIVSGGDFRLGPTYYMEADYEPVAVRIYAGNAPNLDARIDIFADGVSIFTDHSNRTYSQATGYDSPTPVTTVALYAGENSEAYAEDFASDIIEKGAWVYCNLVDAGGGINFTVQLELEQVSEGLEPED